MLILCKDPRPGPVTLMMGNETYVFRPDDKGRKICSVWTADHVKCFLAVSHIYSEFKEELPTEELAPAAGAPVIENDVLLIKGIGSAIRRTLAALDPPQTDINQVADWTKDDVARVEKALKLFPGRIEREKWVEQAKAMRVPKGLVDSDVEHFTEAERVRLALDEQARLDAEAAARTHVQD